MSREMAIFQISLGKGFRGYVMEKGVRELKGGSELELENN